MINEIINKNMDANCTHSIGLVHINEMEDVPSQQSVWKAGST